MTQDAVESSLPVSQTLNLRDTADDPTNTRPQDGPQDLSFKSMKVSGILQLIELPEGLHSLRIEGCDALEEIPEGIMAGLNQLQHLYIINCCSLNSLPEDHPPTALKKLYVQNCKKLEIFSPTKRTRQYAFLEHLCIGSSDSLISLPLDFFPKLRSLSIWDCANLQSLSMPVEIQKDLTSLEALEIRDCPKLEYFLKGGLSAPNLMSIWLSNCKNLKELPDRLDTLINSLRSLFINNCPELVSVPRLPSTLSLLSITFCYKLELVMDWGLHSLWNLSRLEIEGGCKNVESFPGKGLLPINLNSLCISGLMNLKYLKCEELQHLTALKTLEISCCNKIQPFPEEDLPSSLSLLCIKECSLLKPKLLKKRKMFD
nr:putative disease resistance protein At3g14460 [Quercus suber]POE54591.1 putative disease resistance protein [Quercus suber]